MSFTIVVNPCPICDKPGVESYTCVQCERKNFSPECFDVDTSLCLDCQVDFDPVLKWADANNLSHRKIPRDAKLLRQLKHFHLQQNAGLYNVTTLPAELCALANLEDLLIACQDVREYPRSLAKLSRLRKLTIATQELALIPDFVADLQSLELLSLLNNQLTDLPEFIKALDKLETLNVSKNQFTTLPGWLSEMSGLTHLYAWDNPLEELPDSLFTQSNLKHIDISGTVLARDDQKLAMLRASHPDIEIVARADYEVKK